MYSRARRGIGYLAQEPSVFRGLTVRENILAILETISLTAANGGAAGDPARGAQPDAAGRPAGVQAVGRGAAPGRDHSRAVISPRFILLDEPFVGIDPIAVAEIQDIVGRLRGLGLGVLITDHNVRETLRITDRAYIVNEGAIFRSGTPESLAEDEEVRRVYLGSDFRLD